MRRINLGNFEFSVKVEDRNIKHTYIKIDGDRIIIRTPLKISEERVKELVFKKLIKLELDKVNREFLTEFLFFGDVYKIIPNKDFYIDRKNKIVFFNPKNKKDIRKYLESSLKSYVRNYLRKVYRKFGLEEVPKIEIKAMKNKLGYLKNGKILLNFDLCFFPRHLIRYVIDHELIHYKVNSHNVIFNHLISSIYPDYREFEKELKKFLIIVRYNKRIRKIINN